MNIRTIVCIAFVFSLACQEHKPEKVIFAHYMGCYPLDRFDAKLEKIDHQNDSWEDAIGGRHVNWPLLPSGMKLTEIEAAALDIRRAIRGGIDGFAVDVLAGREIGMHTFNLLFEAAERYDLPFQITFCLDNQYRNPAAIKHVVDKYKDHPKLARRNGKILFFGYYSQRDAQSYVEEYFTALDSGRQVIPEAFYQQTNFEGLPQLPRDTMAFPELSSRNDLSNKVEAYTVHSKVFRKYEESVGVPLHLQFELSSILRSRDSRFTGESGFEEAKRAVDILSQGFNSVGAFLPSSFLTDDQIIELSETARGNGSEWGEALNYQYDNHLWERIHIGDVGLQMQKRWEMIEKTGSTILQFTTWNDYAENTQLAPAQEIKYTYLDLNAYFVEKWKTGREPEVTEDKIYVIYPKYLQGAEVSCFPFNVARRIRQQRHIEVITILKSPATVRMPGRNEEWQAEKGFSYKQIPLVEGKVEVQVVREGSIAKSLSCPEPIVRGVFKEQATPTCFSTEFEKHWRADFGEREPEVNAWYSDDDGDGLPNWFEMYWFGRYGDWTTSKLADPAADQDGDGITNMDEYLNGTNPKSPNSEIRSGFNWDLIADVKPGLSFNPDRDKNEAGVWYYKSVQKDHPAEGKLFDLGARYPATRYTEITHKFFTHDLWNDPYRVGREVDSVSRSSVTHKWYSGQHTIVLNVTPVNGSSIVWISPVDGRLSLNVELEAVEGNAAFGILYGGEKRKAIYLDGKAPVKKSFSDVRIKKGDEVIFFANPVDGHGSVEVSGLKITLDSNGK